MCSLIWAACLLAFASSQNVFALENDEPATNSTLLPTSSPEVWSPLVLLTTTKSSSLADSVICKIDENLHEGTLYNGSLFNCTHARGCLMNDDRRLEAEKTVLLCIDQLDGRTHKCIFEWYVHWRECVGFNCYGIVLDCEYQKRAVTNNVEAPTSSISSKWTLITVLMLAFGIAAGAVLILSLLGVFYLYHYRRSGMVDFRKRERVFAALMAKNHTTADPPMFCTISAYDAPFVIATHE